MSKYAITAWTRLLDMAPHGEAASHRRTSTAMSSGLLRLLGTAWQALVRSQRRAATRDDLKYMPDWLLRDLGITRHAALREARRDLSRPGGPRQA